MRTADAGGWGPKDVRRRTAPFVAIVVLAFLTLPLTDRPADVQPLIAAVALTVATAVAVAVIAWKRLPRHAAVLPPFLGLVIVGLLRHAEGGALSGYAALVLVSVVWLALYGSRGELLTLIGVIAVVFIVPILVFGEPDYPATEWRRAIMMTALAAFVGLTTQGLVRQVRLRVSEAERQARAEAEREAYLRAVMDSAAEGIVALGTDGRATFVNPAAAAMLGYSVEELEGERIHDLVHHTRRDGSQYPVEDCPIVGTIESGRPAVVSDEVYWRRDGTSFPVEYRATPMVVDGRTTGVVNTFSDISERLAVEKMKSEFVSVVSHELRTPLTSIRGSLGLMEGGVLGDLSDEAQKMLRIAISNADRLVRLINDILDAERIDSGNAPMQMRTCNVGELMTQTRELLAASAEGAGVTLEVQPLDAELVVDPDRITQTLVNLIGNAIKFSPSGSKVRVEAERADAHVYIFVMDQGPGVPAAERDKIFDRFAQVESPDTRVKGGSGLGLAIARGIVEQHGGRIWIESSDARGSTFAFELPLARETSENHQMDDASSRLGVLIVEDDADLADVLLARFRRRGISGRRTASVGDAERLLEAQRPELIVLDLGLPGTDGGSLIEWLREQNRLGDSAVLVYTARDVPQTELRELQQVGEVVTKSRVTPDDFERLALETLERVRSRHANGSAS